MKLSTLSNRISASGADAWHIHTCAKRDRELGKDVIIMSVGDNEVDTASPIVNTAISALKSGDTHYTAIPGRDTLRLAVADYQKKAFDLSIMPENVTITAGTQNALFISMLLLLEPGDEVIVADPMYVTYGATLTACGAKIVRLQCKRENGFVPDVIDLETLVTSRTKAIFFASPVNPTGAVFDRDTLLKIANIAVRNNLWVVSDEVYGELIFEGSHCAMATLQGMKERCITVGSLSKSHAMTGWRVGWVIGPKGFSEKAAELCLCMTYGLPGFIQEAAVVALAQDTSALKELYRQRRNYALRELDDLPNMNCSCPKSGMFLLLPIDKTGMDGDTFVRELYKNTGVSVLNAELFGAELRDMVRINFVLEERELSIGLNRIKTFYKSALQAKGSTHCR